MTPPNVIEARLSALLRLHGGRQRSVRSAGRFLELDPNIACMLQSAADIFLKATKQQPSNRKRRARGQSAPFRLAIQNRGQGLRERVFAKRGLSGQSFVEDAPESPNVRPLIDVLATSLLRAHVTRRAHDGAESGALGSRGRL